MKERGSTSEQNLLQLGGTVMKFRGITIQKHKTCNTWYARYRKNGKQFYVSAKTQKDCYNKLKAILTNQPINDKKQEDKVKALTLVQWYKQWVSVYKKKVQDTTIKDYISSLNSVETLKNKPINALNSIEIMKALNKVTQPRRRQKAYEFLKMLLEKALQNDLISKNPMIAVDKPEYVRKNGQAFSPEDEEVFVKICQEKQLDAFLVALYQGFRRGEVLAITSNDLDFTNKTIVIDKSLKGNGRFGPTKNNSDRVVPMFDKTLAILEKYKNKHGRIFDLTTRESNDLFKKIVEENLQNKSYTIKTLRYTFITKCQESGVPLHIVQKWVGHKKGSLVTTKVYTQVREVAELENIEKINKN